MADSGVIVEIHGAFERLCRLFVGPDPRMSLVPVAVSSAQAYKRMKRALFEALFVKSRFTDTVSASVNNDLLHCVLRLRSQGCTEEAARLELLAEKLLNGASKDYDRDSIKHILRFMLLLSQPMRDDQKHVIGFGAVVPNLHVKPKLTTNNVSEQSSGRDSHGDDVASFFMHPPLQRYHTYARSLFEESFTAVDERMLHLEGMHCAKPYTNFPRNIFEQLPGITPTDHNLLEVKGILNDSHDRLISSTLFGALSRPCNYARVPTLKLDLPDLTDRSAAAGILIPNARRHFGMSSDSYDTAREFLVDYDITDDHHSCADEGFSEAGGSSLSLPSLQSGLHSIDEAICLDSPTPEVIETPRYLTWENRKRTYNHHEKPYLTEAGAVAFDDVYDLHMNSLCMVDPSLSLPIPNRIPLAQLMRDTLNVLLSLPTASYVLDEARNTLSLKAGIAVSGLSCEAISSVCAEFSAAGTRHRRLTAFCSPAAACHVDGDGITHERGLVFRAFSSAVHSYLQWYRECIVNLHDQSPLASLRTPMQLKCYLGKLLEQLELLSRLCCCEGEDGMDWKSKDFPNGIHLLSLLYKTATHAVGRPTCTLTLMLLHASCKPYLRFISDWAFFGILSDRYEEFMISVDDSKILCRDRRYWTEGFMLMEANGDDKFPLFLKALTKGIYVCGKSMHLLRLCNPDHFLCAAVEQEVPPLDFVYMHEKELNDVFTKSQAYIARVKQMAKHKLFSRTAVLEQRELAKHDLMVTARTAAAQEVERLQKKIVELRKAEDAKKRQNFQEMKDQMEEDLKRRANAAASEKSENAKYIQSLLEREKVLTEREKELEARAREELIEEYAQLTEAAARREQRALWRVRRRRRDNERLNFLLVERDRLLEEQSSLLLPSSRVAAAAAEGIPLSKEELPRALAAESLAVTASASDPPAQATEDAAASSTEKSTAAGREMPAPSDTSGRLAARVLPEPPQLLLSSSEQPAAASAIRPVDRRHVSAESSPADDVPKSSTAPVAGRHVSSESAPALTQKPLVALAELGRAGAQPEPSPLPAVVAKVEGRHVSMTSEPQAGPLRPCVAPVDGRHASAESEPAAEARPLHRAQVDGRGISVESEERPARPHLAAVQGRHASVETTRSAQEPTAVRPCVAVVPGRHVSQQSEPTVSTAQRGGSGSIVVSSSAEDATATSAGLPSTHRQQSPSVSDALLRLDAVEVAAASSSNDQRLSDDAHAIGRSASVPSTGATGDPVQRARAEPPPTFRSCVAAVDGRHASAESCPEPQAELRPRVARVAGRHVSMESEPTAARMHRTGLGTLSEAGHEACTIAGPPAWWMAAAEQPAVDGTYQIRSRRKKGPTADAALSQAPHIHRSQHQPTAFVDAGAVATATASSSQQGGGAAAMPAPRRPRVHDESEYVDEQAVRVHRFKERNFKGHSSDSTVQKLLYGTGGAEPVDKDSPGKAADEATDKYDDTSALKAVEECIRSMPSRYDDPHDCFGVGAITGDLMKRINNQSVSNETHPCPYHGDACPGRPICVPMYEYTSLAVLLHKSLSEPLAAQVSLVNSSLLSYFMVDLSIDQHFEALRRYLLMENGEYSQVMGDLLFEKLDTCPHARDMLNPVFLNQVLAKALQSSADRTDIYASNLAFALRTVPAALPSSAPDVFSCLELKYKVDWPLNIVLSESTLAKYSQVFSFMLQLRRIVYALKETWVMLKRAAVVHGAARCVQLLQLQLFRHEMQHFVKVMQGYVANQVIDVAWREFQDSLQHEVLSLDELYQRHAAYVNHCLVRCLLNKKASAISKIINTMFGLILKVRSQLKSGSWQTDAASGTLQHPAFPSMLESYSSFKQYSEFLFKVISKLATRGYQPQHLQELLIRMNFNDYYEH